MRLEELMADEMQKIEGVESPQRESNVPATAPRALEFRRGDLRDTTNLRAIRIPTHPQRSEAFAR